MYVYWLTGCGYGGGVGIGYGGGVCWGVRVDVGGDGLDRDLVILRSPYR